MKIFLIAVLCITSFAVAEGVQQLEFKSAEFMPLVTCPNCGAENVHPQIHRTSCPAKKRK